MGGFLMEIIFETNNIEDKSGKIIRYIKSRKTGNKYKIDWRIAYRIPEHFGCYIWSGTDWNLILDRDDITFEPADISKLEERFTNLYYKAIKIINELES